MSQKKNENDLFGMIDKVISDAKSGEEKSHDIVDIITFCESPKYLNFLGQDPKLELWPMQRIVLKFFYRGSKGNEHVQLTEDEIKVLEDIAEKEDLDYFADKGGFRQVVDKYRRWTIFNTLLLIMGRRSSKTMMVSIIAAYEAYKLLECPEGNPQKYYGMPPDKPIYIMNLAVTEQQAIDPLFIEIRSRLARGPYFADKINNNVQREREIHLLTKNDKAENAKREANGIVMPLTGSVIMMSGTSNSPALRGKAAIAILFDEFAHFHTSTGKSSGDAVFSAMAPSVKQFGDDGKLIILSDPAGKEGMFWKLFELAQDRIVNEATNTTEYPHDYILALQLPTWRMNPKKEFTRENLERTERAKNPLKYLTSYGAKFVGAQGSRFFDPGRIDACIDIRLEEPQYGDPRYNYFIHLDPATTSHYYALAMVHPVLYKNAQGDSKQKIVVDAIRAWQPSEKGPVDLEHVEKCIKEFCSRFRVASVTFDTFQSAHTIQSLKRIGVNSFETPYRLSYITKIYGELRNLVNQGDIILPPHTLLIGEMKCLMHKLVNNGFRREVDENAEFPTDDCCDALAGAVYQALKREVMQSLPRSAVVYMGRR